MRFTFQELLLADTVGVSGWRRRRRRLGGLAARRRGLGRLRVEQRQQGAPIVPAGVVGKVGADETVGEAQFLVHRNAGHLHHHPPVVPAVDWATGGEAAA